MIDEILGSGPDPSAPMRLRHLHRQLTSGDTVAWNAEAASDWPPELLDAVLRGAGFARDELQPGALTWEWTLPDTVGADMSMLIVGLNPSPMAADLGVGFARPGNRFWPAALSAGIVDLDRDPEAALADRRVGMTDLVNRTTRQAKELSTAEFRGGLSRLEALCEWLRPGVVCVVGLSGWRAAADPRAGAGLQKLTLGGRPVYLMPNPSGLNAHITIEGLAEHFRCAAEYG